MNQLLTDLRSGVRMLVKYPTLSIVAVLTLGLGIGLSTTVFCVVNGGLFNFYVEGSTVPWMTAGTYTLIQYSGAGPSLESTSSAVKELREKSTKPVIGSGFHFFRDPHDRNRIGFAHRCAAVNLRRLINLGLYHDGHTWAIAT